MMHKLIVIFCLFLIGIQVPCLSMVQSSETRNIKRGFQTTGNVAVEIDSKYGRIEIIPWNKDSVVIEVTTTVKTTTKEKLSKYFDNIDYEFNSNQNFVTARTIFDKNRTPIGSSLVKVRESLMISDGSISVDYIVHLPGNAKLDITNKFGNIYLGDYMGGCRIDLANGKLKANNLSGQLTLKLYFADASINKLADANIDINYGKFYLKEAQSIIYKGKSSNLDIGIIKNFASNSLRDIIHISEIGNLTGSGYFTDFKISTLKRGIKLSTRYGDMDISLVTSSFNEINIISKSTDLRLNFAPETKLNYDITYMKCKTDLSKSFDLINEKVINEKEGRVRINGFMGKNKSDNPVVNVNAESGTLYFSAQ